MQPDEIVKPEGKCWGYVRASTVWQEDSPEVQKGKLERWAEGNGIDIDIVVDDAISAYRQPFEKRPQGRSLLLNAKDGDWIVFCDWDRFLRQRGGLYLVDELRSKGIFPFGLKYWDTVKQAILHQRQQDKKMNLLDNPKIQDMATMETIQVAFAQHESMATSRRVKEVFAYRRALGLPTNGRADYGHKIVRLSKEQDPKRRTVFEPKPIGKCIDENNNTIVDDDDKLLDETVGEQDLYWIAQACKKRMDRVICRRIAELYNKMGIRCPLFNRRTGEHYKWSRQRVSRVTLWYWKKHNIRPPRWAKQNHPAKHNRKPLI